MREIKKDFTVEEFVSETGRVLYKSKDWGLTDEEYDAIKPVIGFLNGAWRQKEQCFVFGYNPNDMLKDMLDMWHNGNFDRGDTEYKDWSGKVPLALLPFKYREWQETLHFFPTPEYLGKQVVGLCDIGNEDIVMEPSAGQGNLLKHIPKCKEIIAIEMDQHNCKVLREKGYRPICGTFEAVAESKTDLRPTKVVMNPPFFKGLDMKHIMLAYDLLEKDGTLVAIMSENNLYYDTELTKEFWQFLKDTNAEIVEVPFGEFVSSGTMVYTVIVKIVK